MKFQIWVFFGKSVVKIQVSLKSDKNNGHSKTSVYFWSSLSQFSVWEMFQTVCVEVEHSFLFSFSFRKSCRFWDNVEEYWRAGYVTDGNMAHAHCMLDTKGYRHTLKMCSTYCISTASIVTRTCQIVTLYVHCLCRYSNKVQMSSVIHKLQEHTWSLSVVTGALSICDHLKQYFQFCVWKVYARNVWWLLVLKNRNFL